MPQKLSKVAKRSLKNYNFELTFGRRGPHLKDFFLKNFSSSSLFSFITVAVSYGAFYFIPLFPIPQILTNSAIQYLETLWGVQGGILAITVTVVVFIVQSINTRYTRQNIFKIFIRKSFILPIIYLNLANIAGVMGLLFYHDPANKSGLIIFTSFVFLASILLIARLYKSVFDFLDPVKVQEFRINELIRVFEKSLAEELLEKTAESDLIEFCKLHGLSYQPWESERNKPIKTNQDGRIVDVDLSKISSLKKKLRRANMQTGEPTLTIIKSIGDYTGEFNRTLMEVSNSTVDETLHQKLVSCFKIRDIASNEDQLGQIFQDLSDESSLAIANGSPSEIKNICRAYKEIFKKFSNVYIKFIQQNPSNSTQPLAHVEWESFTWVLEQFKDLIPNALTVERIDFLDPLINLPYQMMRISQINEDNFTFRTLQRLSTIFYYHSSKVKDENVRRHVRRRSWSRSYDFYRRHLMSSLNRDNVDFKNIDFAMEACDNTLILFSEILRYSIEQNDLETFKELNNAMENLTDHFYFRSLDNYHQIEHKLENPEIYASATEQIESLTEEIQQLQKLKKMKESLIEKRRALWHALGAWLLHNCGKSTMEPDKVRVFYDILKREFESIDTLLRSLNTISERKVNDFYGLTWWIDFPEGKVRYGSWTDLWAFVFYIFRGSELNLGLGFKSYPAIEGIVSKTSRALDFIQEGQNKWVGEILSQETRDKFGAFLELNEQALAEQKSIDKQRKIDSTISPKLVEKFSRIVVQCFTETAIFRSLFSKIGNLAAIHKAVNEAHDIDLLIDLPKEIFIEEYETPLIGQDMIGQQIAEREDMTIADLILYGINPENVIQTPLASLYINVVEKIKKFVQDGHPQAHVVFSYQFANPIKLEKLEDFVAHWKIPNKLEPANHFLGLLHEVPAFSSHLDKSTAALIVDLDKLGILYCDEPETEIKENKPGQDAEKQTDEEKILRVNLRINDPLILDIEDPNAAIVFRLVDQDV